MNWQKAQAAQQRAIIAANTRAYQHQQWIAATNHARAQAAAAPIKCPACSRINAPRSLTCGGCASQLFPNRPYLPPPPPAPVKPSVWVQVWRGFRQLPTFVQVLAWLFVLGTISSALGLGHDQPVTTSPRTVITSTVNTPYPVVPQTNTEGTP